MLNDGALAASSTPELWHKHGTWNGNGSCGDLNLAREKSGWTLPRFATGSRKRIYISKARCGRWVKTSERSLHPACIRWRKQGKKRKRERENLVFYFLNFKGTSAPQCGHLKPRWRLTLPFTFLSPFLLQMFWLTLQTLGLLSEIPVKLLWRPESRIKIWRGFCLWYWKKEKKKDSVLVLLCSTSLKSFFFVSWENVLLYRGR